MPRTAERGRRTSDSEARAPGSRARGGGEGDNHPQLCSLRVFISAGGSVWQSENVNPARAARQAFWDKSPWLLATVAAALPGIRGGTAGRLNTERRSSRGPPRRFLTRAGRAADG
ncbi:hypothetical protein SKAU_G00162270 [Synaphobranchus kaupii]|uniref:Uncharacterized protein n=1 Tax=Synaphobranchus kaupii TaxID=118154 RepID=A0A9Q1J005_SYNKA|nr:hypothetical protein SKAU_G00162270 [Synaphobranchus kaupii]